jgi:hypothetical protein
MSDEIMTDKPELLGPGELDRVIEEGIRWVREYCEGMDGWPTLPKREADRLWESLRDWVCGRIAFRDAMEELLDAGVAEHDDGAGALTLTWAELIYASMVAVSRRTELFLGEGELRAWEGPCSGTSLVQSSGPNCG